MFLSLFIGNNTFHFKDFVPKNYNYHSMNKEIFRLFSNSNISINFLLELHIFILDQKSFEQNTITYKLACHFPFLLRDSQSCLINEVTVNG